MPLLLINIDTVSILLKLMSFDIELIPQNNNTNKLMPSTVYKFEWCYFKHQYIF